MYSVVRSCVLRARATNADYDDRYHNFRHAMDVVQFYYKLVSDMVHKDMLRPVDIFAGFIAAIAHDVGHPGALVFCYYCCCCCCCCCEQLQCHARFGRGCLQHSALVARQCVLGVCFVVFVCAQCALGLVLCAWC